MGNGKYYQYFSEDIRPLTCVSFVTGQGAFLPKYLEFQFNLTASHAAMLVGAVVVPAGAAGTLLGGFLLKKFNLNREGAIKLYMVCQLIILPLYFGFLFNCPTPSIAGVNVPYPNDTVIERLSQCNTNCDCSDKSQQGLFSFFIISNLLYLKTFTSVKVLLHLMVTKKQMTN